MSRERISDGKYITVKVHRRCWFSCRSGGEGEHADIVGRSGDGFERRALDRGSGRQGVLVRASVSEDLETVSRCAGESFDESLAADRQRHAGDLHQRLWLA